MTNRAALPPCPAQPQHTATACLNRGEGQLWSVMVTHHCKKGRGSRMQLNHHFSGCKTKHNHFLSSEARAHVLVESRATSTRLREVVRTRIAESLLVSLIQGIPAPTSHVPRVRALNLQRSAAPNHQGAQPSGSAPKRGIRRLPLYGARRVAKPFRAYPGRILDEKRVIRLCQTLREDESMLGCGTAWESGKRACRRTSPPVELAGLRILDLFVKGRRWVRVDCPETSQVINTT